MSSNGGMTMNGELYECVSKSFRIGRLEQELHMIQLSSTKSNFIAVL